MKAFKRFSLHIPKGSVLYGDRAYNNSKWEDFLSEHAEINLIAQRRKRTKRPLRGELRYLQSRMRKRIETTFSQITSIFPRNIKAVTSKGFEIKVFNFILAYIFNLFFKERFSLSRNAKIANNLFRNNPQPTLFTFCERFFIQPGL